MHAHRGVDRRTGRTWECISGWFGYKLHLVVDTRHELLVAFSVERAGASERKVLRRDLDPLFRDDPALAEHCRAFCSDRGCDGGPLNTWLRIMPVIDARIAWREDWDAMGAGGDLPKLRALCRDCPDNVLHSERDDLFCRCPATGVVRLMALQDLEAKCDALKHRCPATPTAWSAEAGNGAARRRGCLGRTLRVRLRSADQCILTPLQVGLAFAVMMALELGGVKADVHGRMRSLIRPPPPRPPCAFAA